MMMATKKTPSAKPQAAKPAPSIPECPAFPTCREKGVGCEICLQLSPEAWREHVKKAISRS